MRQLRVALFWLAIWWETCRCRLGWHRWQMIGRYGASLELFRCRTCGREEI